LLLPFLARLTYTSSGMLPFVAHLSIAKDQVGRGQEDGRQNHLDARAIIQQVDRAQHSRRLGTHQVADW
jgi:hypothetical protein